MGKPTIWYDFRMEYLTSESVTEGHPDKLADQIADAILDELLRQDPQSRVAVEVLISLGLIVIAGEVTTRGYAETQKIARRVIREAGYDDPTYGFDADGCGILVSLHEQSPDIALGVVREKPEQIGAGDQGLMYGYATKETKELMPLPIVLAHALTRRLAEVRKKKILSYLRPDGKAQVTIAYKNGKPHHAENILVSAQHGPDLSLARIRRDIERHVIRKTIPTRFVNKTTKILVNPTGRFVMGGPAADTGLTGRKIIVDTYGGVGSHGGGAFCVAGDSIINTEHGLGSIKELSSMKRGELIKTDISPTPIDQWIDNGEMETLTTTTKDGYELEGTLSQRVRVIDTHGDYIWRRLDELHTTDWLAIQIKNRMFGKGELPAFEFVHKPGTFRKNSFMFPKTLTEDYAYLMGLLIGDGRCTTRDGVQLCVCERQMEHLVQNLFIKLFGRKGKIFGHWAFFCGVELRAFLQNLGIDYHRSWQKRVPKSIWTAPRPVIAAFIRGLFDTDGTVRKTGRNKNSADVKLTTTSKKLAQDIQQLLLNFGIVSNVQTVNTTGKITHIRGRIVRSARPLYHVRVKGYAAIKIFHKDINFGLPRKAKILNDIMHKDYSKRNLLRIPNQLQRVNRLWNKLSSHEHQEDIANIGRWLRDPGAKGTKELTYEKLAEFLDAYENKFAGDPDFEYLRMFYTMNHYYTQVKYETRGQAHVYDFAVPGAHTFIANGFVCHNSGKDPTKVDRSASYAARWVAKNIVVAGLAWQAEVRVAYAIGVPEPLAVSINTHGTGVLPDEQLSELVKEVFDLRPGMIIKELGLRKPIYRQVATYGHFGRNDLDLPWEKISKQNQLKRAAKKYIT